MLNRAIIILAIIGIFTGLGAAYLMSIKNTPLPPAYPPVANPFHDGIYANGIIETAQHSGENINIYPEVSATITRIHVKDGDHIQKGTPLFDLEDSVQQANLLSQQAQIKSAKAQYKLANDSYLKVLHAWQLNHDAISQDGLDNARNSTDLAAANLEVAEQQYQGTLNLLKKYHVTALSDGKVLTVNAAVGGFVSTQGVYDSYTQQYQPLMILGNNIKKLSVRSFIDEILIAKLPSPDNFKAYMYIRGTNYKIPLEFNRILPLVTPKIELSNQRTERVDVRVLPIIFTFTVPQHITLYPGQLVDVYIGASSDEATHTPHP